MASFRLVIGLAAVSLLAFGLVGPLNGGVFGQEQLAVTTFSSTEDFQQYLNRSPPAQRYAADIQPQTAQQAARADAAEGGGGGSTTTVDRYSTTNVQEQGIQEPDILKTDGRHFYYAPEQGYYYDIGISPTIRSMPAPKYRPVQQNTTIFNTLPADNVTEQAQLPGTGKLLLLGDTLVRMQGRTVEAFNVADPSNPEQTWSITLNTSRVTARSYGGEIYLVTREGIDRDNPCPIVPATTKDGSVSVPCDAIYHPRVPVAVDTTYTVMTINPDSGEITDTAGFVGTQRNSVVYMSSSGIYVTYLRQQTRTQIFLDFFAEQGDRFFDEETATALEELQASDMGYQAKQDRFRAIVENATQNMTAEERERIQDEFDHAFGNYTQEHRREFTTTGIVKIPVGDVRPAATGEVPGKVLNQFSIDEQDGNLRIATTVGVPGTFSSRGSVNDLYVLGSQLERRGAVTGMGLDEQIYSVRFIRDRAYVVTFRRIDPFHVIDLSNPNDPELQGTLKLPGFSSYLHPLSRDRVLGIGEEDGRVKAVIFDVSNASNPTIADDVILEDYSSEIGETHHAFTIDRKHKIFVLPGTEKSYIFSYKDGLERVKAVELQNPLRSRYVNNYLYLFGGSTIKVVDERDWQVVDTVRFREQRYR